MSKKSVEREKLQLHNFSIWTYNLYVIQLILFSISLSFSFSHSIISSHCQSLSLCLTLSQRPLPPLREFRKHAGWCRDSCDRCRPLIFSICRAWPIGNRVCGHWRITIGRGSLFSSEELADIIPVQPFYYTFYTFVDSCTVFFSQA